MEDDSVDEESEKDSNDTIADVIEIGIGRESLETLRKKANVGSDVVIFPLTLPKERTAILTKGLGTNHPKAHSRALSRQS